MSSSIAIVGMSCVYPDATSPVELWENALAQRRAFRRLPSERLNAADYFSADPQTPDATYSMHAAVIADYEFDRVKFKVAGGTYRSADLAHWLALDVASRALADAGYENGAGLPRETTRVVLANTLTGEFSRAGLMRLRWPYVRRTVAAALQRQGWSEVAISGFVNELEQQYKAPFPPVGEESLAGGLSNTIAGRICNHFDFKGGGYAVDGACASSLLAVATACAALAAGDVDVALAGGVDLSLDPFEVVGFAKTGALAPEEMRVYEARSAGFWPGEGCGFVVLMRHADALAAGRRIYALIRGWGISSDGQGGMTRPEEEGQILALRRAYQRTDFTVASPAYFEGHGTGTMVGDATELRALSRARREASMSAAPAAVGSIKANIGHTKAAAGMAGLLRATLAVQSQVLPPLAACDRIHPELAHPDAPLRVPTEPELWPADQPLRAGISAMGFGGINAHVVIESPNAERRAGLNRRELALGRTPQDCELFVFSAKTLESLQRSIQEIANIAPRLSQAELLDLAAELASRLGEGSWRAALVAARPAELAIGCHALDRSIRQGRRRFSDVEAGVFLGATEGLARIGLLFPGQGSPVNLDGGVYRRRFEEVATLYANVRLRRGEDSVATQVAQPAILRASLAGLHALNVVGIEGELAVGHSLGEIAALHWAGAFSEASALRIAEARGNAMAELGDPTGAMAVLPTAATAIRELLAGTGVVIAGYNSSTQTVISGSATEVGEVLARAQARGLRGTRLPVSHAFHSPLVAAAQGPLSRSLAAEEFRRPNRTVISTVLGSPLGAEEDLRELLCRQVTSPVRFIEAVTHALGGCELLIEVGPGQVLGGLVQQQLSPPHVPSTRESPATERLGTPVVSLDAAGHSVRGLVTAVGLAYVLGARVRPQGLFTGRHSKAFRLPWAPKFFANPCESAPLAEPSQSFAIPDSIANGSTARRRNREEEVGLAADASGSPPPRALDVVRSLLAERVELPIEAVHEDSRLLGDLHLNSISIGQLVVEAARRLRVGPLAGLNEFANSTVAEVAEALDDLARNGSRRRATAPPAVPAGLDHWLRAFAVDLVPRALPKPADRRARVQWSIVAPQNHPWAGPLAEKLGASEPADVATESTSPPTAKPAIGVIVCLPAEPPEAQYPLLLQAARMLTKNAEEGRFIVVQHGPGGGGFARTLFLERRGLNVSVVTIPPTLPRAVDAMVEEALAAHGYQEAAYAADGTRLEPRLRVLDAPYPRSPVRMSAEDILLVSGGGKGIAAESALALAQRTGVRLALMGRSQPQDDAVLAANLERFTAASIRWRYFAGDVTDRAAVNRAVQAIEHEWGPVTGILHGAGANVPQLIEALDDAAFARTLAPKITGLRNLLEAVPSNRLRWLITFSSIIGRSGLPGEADYAFANEWLSGLTAEFQRTHPDCRCLALEWSVWSGVGMGERLGRVETLLEQGITPISPDTGIQALCELVESQMPAAELVVSSRFGLLPTLKLDVPELPLRRFLEKPLLYYPGIELIVEARLSVETDPYVLDHLYRGERLFPAVMGLEAMAQVVMALAGSETPPDFEEVTLERPVVVAPHGPTVIRLVALAREAGVVEVALRMEATGFDVDHFRARCLFERLRTQQAEPVDFQPSRTDDADAPLLSLNPKGDLYGRVMFQSGRFERIEGYEHLQARECVARLRAVDATDWFGRYLPETLALGDPGARDAGMHAIQACIPFAQLLPTGVARIRRATPPRAPSTSARTSGSVETGRVVRVHAVERDQSGDDYIYDVEFLCAEGSVIEQWLGLRLRRIEPLAGPAYWPPALLVPYLQRKCEEWFGTSPTASLAFCDAGDLSRSERAAQLTLSLLGKDAKVLHRPDGKPELLPSVVSPSKPGQHTAISFSHCGPLTLAFVGSTHVACDLERVEPKSPDTWNDLLGSARARLAQRVSAEAVETLDTSATRLWIVRECLKKAGAAESAPVTLDSMPDEGWVLFRSGADRIATYVTCIPAPGATPHAIGFMLGTTLPRTEVGVQYRPATTPSELLAASNDFGGRAGGK